MHTVALAALYFPVSQLTQELGLMAPRALEYVPAAHEAQNEAPLTLLYVPAGHVVHELCPASEYVPVGQLRQAATVEEPVTLLNVPLGHSVFVLLPVQ